MSDKHLDAIMQFADPNVRPQDDLFRAINGKWLDETVIPDDLPSYGSFVKLRLQADDDVHTIVRELSELPPLSKDALSGEAKIVRDLYSSWMDTESMNRRGLSSLYCEIDLLDGAQTPFLSPNLR